MNNETYKVLSSENLIELNKIYNNKNHKECLINPVIIWIKLIKKAL